MKIFSLVHNYYDYCNNWENSLGYFTNRELAEYLCWELGKKYDNINDQHSFWVQEIFVDNSELESYASILNQIEQKLNVN
jgi:hypothetical protein